jgi:hypothetical protein
VDQELKNQLDRLDTSLSTMKTNLDTSLSSMKDYLDTSLSAMEHRLVARIDQKVAALGARVDQGFARVDERFERAAQATAAEIGALHSYIQQAEARFNARSDEHSVRMDRHAALLQSGARQMLRTFQNQEELSRLWREIEERGSDLEKRLFAVERRRDGNADAPSAS